MGSGPGCPVWANLNSRNQIQTRFQRVTIKFQALFGGYSVDAVLIVIPRAPPRRRFLAIARYLRPGAGSAAAFFLKIGNKVGAQTIERGPLTAEGGEGYCH